MRLFDWHERLHRVVMRLLAEEKEIAPVCALALAASEMTGKDPMASGVEQLWAQVPVEDVDPAGSVALMAVAMGYGQHEYPLLAQRGDWVVLVDGRVGFVALDGRRLWVPNGTGYGLSSAGIEQVAKAWRVE
jgi:hypothetical protein